ncbi:MAG: outer membrane lipoprotein chaperone LolA [Pseudohongiella sp.]|nr:outer membrane lipoprotein chaperone LolA [Pseudohongiella sp.]
MIKFSNKVAALVAIIIVSASVQAVAAQAAAIQRLDDLLQGINTLAADVVQLIVESDGGVLEESEIQMYMKKPDGFYWETLTPFPELIVTDGKKLWNYQPDLEQVVVEDWDSSRSELAAQLLNGQTSNLSDEYTIENVTDLDSEYQEFELTPISTDSVYRLITINFLLLDLESIYLNNKNGQQTVWRFENVERNQEIADSVFKFVAPDNIEIIENSYTQ